MYTCAYSDDVPPSAERAAHAQRGRAIFGTRKRRRRYVPCLGEVLKVCENGVDVFDICGNGNVADDTVLGIALVKDPADPILYAISPRPESRLAASRIRAGARSP